MADSSGSESRPPLDASNDAMEALDAPGSQPPDLRCCCGRDGCVFLRHNCSVLQSVERDVHTAAKMGQTLLARHEAYMASAERDRVELASRIEQLEQDNADLEARNRQANIENYSLRDDLDQLNETVKDADTKIELLEATLRDSQREIRRLESAAARAANLERQIAMLEEEQATLQKTIVHTQEEARTAMFRWRQAERGINDLQDQLERMEKEAREERERHVEVLSRIERQRVMENELNTAAGRLKGAAATRSMTDGKNKGNVVSHFVRDILQDNATLQLGISELREMLMSSNDEIQLLREQLLYHQPVDSQVGASASTPTLRAELELKEPPAPSPPRVSQELHVHHHYHVTHKPESKKSKKKRQGLTPGTFTPPHISAPSTPRLSAMTWQNRGALAAAFVPHASKDPSSTSSMHANNRWSLISESPSEFASSAPSSPRNYNRNSMFDRALMESSLSTSPTTSIDPLSPTWRGFHRKQVSELSTRSISAAVALPVEQAPSSSGDQPPARNPRPHPLAKLIVDDRPSRSAISSYTTDDLPDLAQTAPSADDTTIDTPSTDGDGHEAQSPTFEPEDFDPSLGRRPRTLHRALSHESIMSLSNGMDIHTLKVRPSQLTLRPLGVTAAGTNVSAITARPTISRTSTRGSKGSVLLRDNLAMAGLGLSLPSARAGGRTVSGPAVHTRNSIATRQSSSALGRIVSWRPWGGNINASPSPEPSPTATPILSTITVTPALASPNSASLTSKAALGSPHDSLSSNDTFRAPGINQPGVIPGFHEYWAAHQRRGPSSKVTPDDLDYIQEAMREVLED